MESQWRGILSFIQPLDVDEDTDLLKVLSGERARPAEKVQEVKKESNIISL